MLSADVKASIDESVLCWLATADAEGCPSVSPKEVFVCRGDREILIANIASANSVRNILKNDQVCVSFIHVFKQKGFQVYGQARYVPRNAGEFAGVFTAIQPLTGDTYPVSGVICVTVSKVRPIIAPSYALFPDITEAQQIDKAKTTYGV